jgi:aryl-alcohol dehydrogenase-like predicted oxidoreductase
MKQRDIGGVKVGAVGLGGMPMSVEGRPDEGRSIRTIHAALDGGVTLIDTADAYHLGAKQVGHDEVGHNESLIRKAVHSYTGDASDVLLATKGGHLRTEDGTWILNGRPEYLAAAARASARRLGVEEIGLYQFHRPDPAVPYAESIGALAQLLDDGVIRMAGISNANEQQIRLAQDVLGGRLAAVQNQFSPAFRSSEDELRLCATMGIAFLPWSPLGGIAKASGLGERHDSFARVAQRHGVSSQRVCLAWQLSLSPTVIPIPGASRPESITDSTLAAELVLSGDELATLSGVTDSAMTTPVPVPGDGVTGLGLA